MNINGLFIYRAGSSIIFITATAIVTAEMYFHPLHLMPPMFLSWVAFDHNLNICVGLLLYFLSFLTIIPHGILAILYE